MENIIYKKLGDTAFYKLTKNCIISVKDYGWHSEISLMEVADSINHLELFPQYADSTAAEFNAAADKAMELIKQKLCG